MMLFAAWKFGDSAWCVAEGRDMSTLIHVPGSAFYYYIPYLRWYSQIYLVVIFASILITSSREFSLFTI